MTLGAFIGVSAGLVWVAAASAPSQMPAAMEGWTFRFRGFPIGAWLGPDSTPGEIQVYKECGFNTVMVGRYMAHGSYAYPERIVGELDRVHEFGLGAFVDTYTQNDKPWGGEATGEARVDGTHHSASRAELEWLHARVGEHPALIGYLLGDDQGVMSEQLQATTSFLKEEAPHLIPWVCGWVTCEDLAAHGNPIANWQIYPTLYNTNEPAEVQCRMYCDAFDHLRSECEDHGTLPWPMINADGPDVSDSTLRFPVYAAIAYGAQGIWYFTYRNAMASYPEQHWGSWSYAEARARVKPLYEVAKETNWTVRAWGPELLGCRSTLRYSSGWEIHDALAPGTGQLVEQMSGDLLIGILTKATGPPLAAVVNKRVSKTFGGVPEREVTVTFAPEVGRLHIVGSDAEAPVDGRTVTLTLKGGEGALVRLSPAPGRRQALARLARIAG